MTNYENTIYSRIANALKSDYSTISVYGDYVSAPASFPSVSILEVDNTTASQTLDGATTHATLTYQVDVYSNKPSGKKAEAKEIAGLIDKEMQLMGFRRTELRPTQNYLDSTIYRMTGRYSRLVAATTDGRL